MESYTIKDLENLSGIKAHTLRIWEQRYNFLKPERTLTKIRSYSNKELKLVLNVALLNKYGFKVSHINRMDEAEMKEKILALNNAQAQQERIINELIQHMADLAIEEMEEVIDTYVLSRGIEKTILQILFPFLEKIGVLWVTNHINPAQEHLVSNLIRQKLIVGIEGLQPLVRLPKTVLLFLPQGEHHEISLLFMHFLLKNRGINVIYLGANIPMNDVKYVADIKKPDYMYCHLTTAHNFNIERFIQTLEKTFPDIPTVVSGKLAASYRKKLKPTIRIPRTYNEVMEFVMSL